ncbi:siderophore-interacting protein [Jatrophihabitans fulvus]
MTPTEPTDPAPVRRREPFVTHVVRTERLSASLVRVVTAGEALAGFAPEFADAYVKIVFPSDGDGQVRTRTYTVRHFDADARELTLDFVVHGDKGLAGPWAAAAQPGDELRLLGPGGGYRPSAGADWHALAGDESALPAIAAALEHLPAGAPGRVWIEVHGPADEIALPEVPGVEVAWLHRGSGAVGSRLVEAVTSWAPPAGTGHWFVHGEAAAVRDIRRHLRVGLGLPMAQLSISGYWRAGADDEAWRAVKREWNQAVEAAEAAV